MGSEALKPCPFCGSTTAEVYAADDIGGYAAHCLTGCGAQTWGSTETEAITVWNTRADDDRIKAAKAERDRLRELPDEVVKAAIDRANAMARQTTEGAFRIVAAALADALQETER